MKASCKHVVSAKLLRAKAASRSSRHDIPAIDVLVCNIHHLCHRSTGVAVCLQVNQALSQCAYELDGLRISSCVIWIWHIRHT